MSVRKPVEKQISVDVDALIDKGAKVKEDYIKEKKWKHINLRISVDMLKAVNKAVIQRVGITRTGWILEAIYEKLKREKAMREKIPNEETEKALDASERGEGHRSHKSVDEMFKMIFNEEE